IGGAAYGGVANLSLGVTSVYTGIAQRTQPILSRLYGYGDMKSIKQTLKYAIRLMLFISGGIYLLFFIAVNPVVGLGFIIIIPLAFLMSFLFRMTGVWMSYPLTESMVALTGMILYKKSGGKKNVQGNAKKKTNFI
ncbi:MAG: MATE family efflux transporter, partial [Lachnospiraceae bacterium]|nr:MATE family efflux transporter [Lachnospiraceae bacterium]